MKKFVEIKASNVDLAVENALAQLGTTRERVEVEILAKGGLFQKASVRVTVLDTAEVKAEDLVNGILERMGLVSRAKAELRDGTVYIEVSGSDSGAAIGYRGEVLDSLQYLTLTYLNQEKCDFAKVVVDCEGYREKRRETLTTLAFRLAEKAQRTCRKVVLEPMNPFERRIIHSALMDSEIAETISEGEEPNRHIVIIPKGVEIREDRHDDRRSGDRRGGDRRNGGRREDRSGGQSSDRRDDRSGDRRDGGNREGGGYRSSGSNRGGERRDGRSGDRRGGYGSGTGRDSGREDSRPKREFFDENEVPDGKEYRGLYVGASEPFERTDDKKTGPPKFKSFGGAKK